MEKKEIVKINDEFLKKRPLSYSSLKNFRLSPKHYYQYVTKPRKPPTDAMLLGSMVECLTISPDEFTKQFNIYSKFSRQSNEGKARWNNMLVEAQKNNQTLVNDELYKKAELIKESVLSHEETMRYIDGKTAYQKKLTWVDKNTKLPIIGYVDLETKLELSDQLIICDMKVSNNGEPDKWMRWPADEFDVQLQVGSYLTGYHKISYQFPDFIFILVESVEPYNVSMIYCDNKYTKEAKAEFKATLTAFRYCMDEDKFDMGYDFWLMDTRDYFSMKRPWKPKLTIRDY